MLTGRTKQYVEALIREGDISILSNGIVTFGRRIAQKLLEANPLGSRLTLSRLNHALSRQCRGLAVQKAALHNSVAHGLNLANRRLGNDLQLYRSPGAICRKVVGETQFTII